jgi:hypothetical protein
VNSLPDADQRTVNIGSMLEERDCAAGGPLEMTNSPVETRLKISHRDGLHITRTFVSVRRWLPIRKMNVSKQNQVLSEPITLGL